MIDFGIARAADRTQLTGTGVALGTVPYMSPEQVEGRPLGPPSDVFSLGGLLAYAATGLTPFGEGGAGEVAFRITREEPDPDALAVGDDGLRDLITRCLRKDPAQRPTPRQIIAAGTVGPPRSAGWLPQAVAARVARREADLTDALERAARKRSGVRVRVGAVSLAVLLVCAVVFALTQQGGRSTRGSGSSASASEAAAQGYRTVFRNRPVSLKDDDSEIDLMTGDRVPGGRLWTLSTDAGGDGKGGFSLQDATDAYVAGSGPITPAQCAAGVARRPVEDEVHWPQVPPGSWFCVRWRLTGDVAVLRVVSTDTGGWGADVGLDFYRHIPALSTPGAVPGPADAHYRPLYSGRPLTLPDDAHSFDLARGRVATNGSWLLSTDAGGNSKGAFEPQKSSEAYIGGQSPLTPARCVLGIAQQPVSVVRFPQVPAGTWFCVRDDLTHEIAVIQVLDKDDGDWTTTVAVTAYRSVSGGG